jgi:predicted small metal-binding protein
MATTVFDCARVPGQNCSVKIIGERDDVLQAAHDHLVSTHGSTAGSDLQQKVTRAVDEHQVKTYAIWGN